MSNMRINPTNITTTRAAETEQTAEQPRTTTNAAEPQATQRPSEAEIGRQTFEAFLEGNIRSAELNAQLPAAPHDSELQQLIAPDLSEVEQSIPIRSNEAQQPGDPISETPGPMPDAQDLWAKGPTAWPPPDLPPGHTY
jgi:hypothetical protein